MNLFEQSLEVAQNGRAEAFWEMVYRKAFPNMVYAKLGENGRCVSQSLGEDRIIYLDNNKKITIEEKCRTVVYNDIALEYISNDYKGTPGWMEKNLRIDYVAYAFLPIKTAYLFDWRVLKKVWDTNKRRWWDQYPKISAQNEYYTTLSLCVPIDVLMAECSKATIIRVP